MQNLVQNFFNPRFAGQLNSAAQAENLEVPEGHPRTSFPTLQKIAGFFKSRDAAEPSSQSTGATHSRNAHSPEKRLDKLQSILNQNSRITACRGYQKKIDNLSAQKSDHNFTNEYKKLKIELRKVISLDGSTAKERTKDQVHDRLEKFLNEMKNIKESKSLYLPGTLLGGDGSTIARERLRAVPAHLLNSSAFLEKLERNVLRGLKNLGAEYTIAEVASMLEENCDAATRAKANGIFHKVLSEALVEFIPKEAQDEICDPSSVRLSMLSVAAKVTTAHSEAQSRLKEAQRQNPHLTTEQWITKNTGATAAMQADAVLRKFMAKNGISQLDQIQESHCNSDNFHMVYDRLKRLMEDYDNPPLELSK